MLQIHGFGCNDHCLIAEMIDGAHQLIIRDTIIIWSRA